MKKGRKLFQRCLINNVKTMKYCVIILGLCFFKYQSFSQSKYDCEVLSYIIKSDDAKKVFSLDKYKGVPLKLIDTGHYFDHCKFETEIYGRQVGVINDKDSLTKKSIALIEILSVIRQGNKVKVNFLYKQTGAVGFIEAKKSRATYKILKSEFGFY